jgi:hypothetical protein
VPFDPVLGAALQLLDLQNISIMREAIHDTKLLLASGPSAIVLSFRGTSSAAAAWADLQASGVWQLAVDICNSGCPCGRVGGTLPLYTSCQTSRGRSAASREVSLLQVIPTRHPRQPAHAGPGWPALVHRGFLAAWTAGGFRCCFNPPSAV